MEKKEYIACLQEKGYQILNEGQVSLGSLIFDIHESVEQTATGSKRTFSLKLSPGSDTNLCPSPWIASKGA